MVVQLFCDLLCIIFNWGGKITLIELNLAFLKGCVNAAIAEFYGKKGTYIVIYRR
jgi:hypothetical protein